MDALYPKRNIIAIDLKSFFAACECLERGLDLYKTPLAVCDPHRRGAITLAVTPYLKSLGVKGRSRIYEIPKDIHAKMIKVPPRMSLYSKKSQEVINVYKEFIAEEDLYIYSIDEVFLDVTNYLALYKKNVYDLTIDILKRIKQQTGLVATAGIGPNRLLAKIAMDIEAKNNPCNIAQWFYYDIPYKLWPITPLSKMWGIGTRLEKKLNNLGLYKIEDIAKYNLNLLQDKFGSLGKDLWYHANGIDLTPIQELNNPPKEQSISHSQVLFKDYNENNIFIIIKEMLEVLTKRLRQIKKQTQVLGLGISYSKITGGGFYHQIKLASPTQNINNLFKACQNLFDKYYDDLPIRKVSINFSCLSDNNSVQLNLFESLEEFKEDATANETIDYIQNKFGASSILKASNLLSDSTIIARNHKR